MDSNTPATTRGYQSTPEERAEIVRIGIEKGIVAHPDVHYHADSYDLPWPGRFDDASLDCHWGEGLTTPADSEPTPTCDLCGEEWEDGGEGEDWNGDTGNHFSCETEHAKHITHSALGENHWYSCMWCDDEEGVE